MERFGYLFVAKDPCPCLASDFQSLTSSYVTSVYSVVKKTHLLRGEGWETLSTTEYTEAWKREEQGTIIIDAISVVKKTLLV